MTGVFEFNEEQRALRAAVRSFAERAFSEAEVRRLMETPQGYDAQTWRRMAEELGLQGLLVPEEHGGAGASLLELAIALDELGRRVAPGPFLSTALATVAILETRDATAAAELLPGIAAGETIATIAIAEESGLWSDAGIDCTASRKGDGWQLQGTKSFVTDGAAADLLIVAARTPEGIALFAVQATAEGVRRTPLIGFDLTRRLAQVDLQDAPARLLGDVDQGSASLLRVLELGAVAVAAEQMGTADFALTMAVDYAKERVQFGRAIGSFQAIKHLCADALLEVESARSAAYYAAWAAADGRDDEVSTVAPLAKAFCSDTAFQVAALNMQVHGGISFTWEHPAHLYYRRAKAGYPFWGDPASHRERLAAQLGL
jgi:alkylation response protein AidB-like acyl-CoA dehydrogenase